MPYQYKREPLNNDELDKLILVILPGENLLSGRF